MRRPRSQKFLGVLIAALFALLVFKVVSAIHLHHYVNAAKGKEVAELKQSSFCTRWEGAAGDLQQYQMRLEDEGIRYQAKKREPSYSGETLICLESDTPGTIIVPKSLVEFEVKVDPKT